ncbi:MAG: NADH-quinone oxidoreductase subunit C [Bacteroidota bacterium]|nr:NADH-quinone oxidoreductase subunit C [Bacteroidota bacterium]MDP4232955.1 NADH-quinone oxidoreductase subunit C [Bacteroidota bacterium]MDP4241999.1 NADH-quinone oxidoreductase subunit C [Bacteroidota bacterium]MDP4286902.1 NADH-quinone oxidoreductase subunit C [Bacteroidota bacterium]
MTQQEIVEHLRSTFGGTLGAWREMAEGGNYQRRSGSYLEIVDVRILRDLAFYLRDEPGLDFNNLMLLSSLDNGDGTLSVVYHIESTHLHHQLALKVTLHAEGAHVPSVTSVWAHANWQEREAWDMMGIRFEGHPDHRRILLDEDYPGHPLRKDFKEPDFYHGMKVPY